MASPSPKFAAASCVFAVCLSLQLIASAQTPLIASGRPNLFPIRAANLSLPTGLYTRPTEPPNIMLATLKPGLVWQRVRPADGNVGGPVLYQLLFSTAGTPGFLAKFDTNPRHLTNSLISESAGQINFGGMVNFVTGQPFPGYLPLGGGTMTGNINFAVGQTFPITGTGGGTVTSITAGTGLSGGTITSSGTITNTGVLSFNTRNGNVVPTSGDYTFAQIGGTLTAPQLPNVAFTNLTNTFTADQRFNNNILLTPPTIAIPATGTVNATLGVFIGPGGGVVGKDTTTVGGIGVQGISNLSGGVGVLGNDTATTGATDGVIGFASSPGGEGVRGVNFAINGGSGVIGVYGNNLDGTPNVSATGGIGVQGFNAAPSGVGVLGKVGSVTGTAGLFDNEGAGCSNSPDCQVLVANANGSTRAIIDGTGDIILKGGVGFSVNNSTVSPPVVNQLTEFDTSVSGQVSIANASTDPTKGVFGVVLSTSAVTGKSQVASFGGAQCAFDGAFNAGNYVVKSTTVAGQCHDAGAAYPTTVQVIGRALGTNATAGTTKIVLFSPEERQGAGAGGGGVTSITAGPGLLGGTITTSGTLSLDTVFTNARYLQLAGGTMTGLINFASGQTFPNAGNGAFLPLAGGTLTGALFGTTSSFSSATNTISSLTGSTTGTGLFSRANATTGTASGVFGEADSPNGTGLFGQATSSAAGSNANGVFGTTASQAGNGVFGNATDATPGGATNGVEGMTVSENGNGVLGIAQCTFANAPPCPGDSVNSGFANGVKGVSTAPNGIGVLGVENDITSPGGANARITQGVRGVARGPNGRGVFGIANSTTANADTRGVVGVADSPFQAIGVLGTTTATTPSVSPNVLAGVFGQSGSPNGYGVFGLAYQPTAGASTGTGVYGESDSVAGLPGVFNNNAQDTATPPNNLCNNVNSCQLLVAQANGNAKFTVDGGGNFTLNNGGAMSFNVDDDTTPTVLNQLAELTSTGKLTNAGTNTAVGTVGVIITKNVGGVATKSQLAVFGTANCIFDNAEVQADYVIKSTTVAGQCHDAGANYPVGVQVVGRAIASVAAGTSGMIVVFPPEERQGGGAVLSTSGSPITTGHTVTGTTTAGATVTLTASAIFTDGTSYVCQARDTTTPTGAVSVNYLSGSSFSITGVTTDAVRFACTGQ